MMVASAGLGAVLAAIVVLVWAFSSGPQSVKQQLKPDAAASPVTAEPVAAKPPEPAKPAAGPGASGLPGGLPGGLPAGLTPSATSSAAGNPLAAFTPSPSVSSGGGGRAVALPPAPKLPKLPDLQTALDTAAPYLLPALAPSVISGDGIASLVGNIGGWATSAAVASFNNATDLLTALILANGSVVPNVGPLDTLVRISQGVTSLSKLPSLMPTPQLPSFNMDLSALDALGKLPAPKIGLPRLPAPPAIGLPHLPAPKIGLPRLPAPPPIGLPRLPPPPPPALIAAFS